MIEIVTIVTVVITVAIVELIVYAAPRPDEFRLERATHVNAPPERIFPFINDFHAWAVWSPYEKIDPALKRTFSGPTSGKGAVYEWDGNNKAGTGRMEITESSPPSRV